MSLQIEEDLDVDSKSRIGQPNFKYIEDNRLLYRSARLQGIKKKKKRGGGSLWDNGKVEYLLWTMNAQQN